MNKKIMENLIDKLFEETNFQYSKEECKKWLNMVGGTYGRAKEIIIKSGRKLIDDGLIYIKSSEISADPNPTLNQKTNLFDKIQKLSDDYFNKVEEFVNKMVLEDKPRVLVYFCRDNDDTKYSRKLLKQELTNLWGGYNITFNKKEKYYKRVVLIPENHNSSNFSSTYLEDISEFLNKLEYPVDLYLFDKVGFDKEDKFELFEIGFPSELPKYLEEFPF